MDDTEGTADPPTGGRARRPPARAGRSRGASKSAAKPKAAGTTSRSRATAKPAAGAKRAKRPVRRTSPPPSPPGDRAPDAILPDPERRPGPRFRNRALYNRRLQRDLEHWPVAARLGTWMFSHPQLVLSAVGRRDPVEVDGRVLNRGSQALLALAARFQPSPARGPDAPADYDPVSERARFTRRARLAMPTRTDVHVSGRLIRDPGTSPAIPVRIYRQFGTGIDVAGDPHRPPAIVYFHGGGWVAGGLDSHDATCRMLAVASGCIVVSVAYRLAPEDPYPAAVDDAVAAYAWVQRHSRELGHAEGRVGVMGDSAGGNLAAVVALETRPGSDGPSDVPPPVAQGLVYPVLDARLDSGSVRSAGAGFFLTLESMEFFRSCYVPDRSLWETPRVSPLLADDHAGLAPALVVTAGFDPLRDDGARYAEALAKSGVDVAYRCYDDQLHGFLGMGVLPDSLALATEVGDAMGRLMRRTGSGGADR